MKLPRWLVIGMLTSSVLAVIGVPCWWWMTWPTRTAREFTALLGAARLDDARKFLASGPEGVPDVVAGEEARRTYNPASIQADHRTIRDVIDGCQRFRLPDAQYAFTVRRDKVIEQEFLDDFDLIVFTLPARRSTR